MKKETKAILTEKDYQVVFSDTPGIIEPKYKLHEKMMDAVKGALEDADIALLIVDVQENWDEANSIFEALRLRVPCIVVINKIDRAGPEKINEAVQFFTAKSYCKQVLTISAASGINRETTTELFHNEIIDNILRQGANAAVGIDARGSLATIEFGFNLISFHM